MLYLFALVFLFFVQDMSAMKYICNPKDPCGCSRRPATTTRIFGGERASPYTWSWAISLRNGSSHFCGGSILNERYIITAAHCLVNINSLSNIIVCAGTIHLSRPCRQRREIQNVINHPSFNSRTYENDIALIQVKLPFNFTDISIARICLPETAHDNEYPVPDTDVIAVGWGTANASDHKPDTLQQVALKIVDESTDDCNLVLRNYQLQLCAAAPEKGKTVLFERCFLFVFSLLLSCRHL
jgi:secreted trypsin-like serine protease